MTCRTGLAALLVAVALLPEDARAQAADQSFEELQRTVRRGDVVHLTDDTGKTVKGRVSDLSVSSMTLQIGTDAQGRVFTPDRTTRITRGDPLTEGILLGLAGGAFVGWKVVRATCGPPGYDGECAASVGVVAVPIALGIGAGVGALVDSVIRKTLYRSPTGSRLTLVPVVGTGERAIHLSVSF